MIFRINFGQNDQAGSVPLFRTRRQNGTFLSPTAVVANDQLGDFCSAGFDGTSFSAGRASVGMFASENWTPTAQGTYLSFSTTSAGTTSLTERMRVDSSGNVGIGLSPSGSKLNVSTSIQSSGTDSSFARILGGDVNGGSLQLNRQGAADKNAFISKYQDQLLIKNLDSGPTVFTNTAGDIERMRITSSGFVGIGTASPDQVFTVQSKGDSQISLKEPDGTTKAYIGTSGAFGSAPAGALRIRSDQGGIVFGQNGVENMRINSSGELLVGTTSSLGGLMTLQSSSPYIFFRNTGAAAGRCWYAGTEAGAAFTIYNINGTGCYIGYGNQSWSGNSDERVKTDLVPIENAITKVSSLRAVTGRYKTDEMGKSRSFLIAQDVQKVLPEAISQTPDGTLGLAYTDTIPLLVAAIKELTAKVEEQAKLIEQLK